VRFGSAEIYSVIEGHFPTVADSICVGQRRPKDNDESVMLFLLMKPGQKFNEKLVGDIKAKIRAELSARHVPRYVFETPDIPVSIHPSNVMSKESQADNHSDYRESEEGRITCQADRIRHDHQA
jgi:acetoacetyl-CoA synthetase